MSKDTNNTPTIEQLEAQLKTLRAQLADEGKQARAARRRASGGRGQVATDGAILSGFRRTADTTATDHVARVSPYTGLATVASQTAAKSAEYGGDVKTELARTMDGRVAILVKARWATSKKAHAQTLLLDAFGARRATAKGVNVADLPEASATLAAAGLRAVATAKAKNVMARNRAEDLSLPAPWVDVEVGNDGTPYEVTISWETPTATGQTSVPVWDMSLEDIKAVAEGAACDLGATLVPETGPTQEEPIAA